MLHCDMGLGDRLFYFSTYLLTLNAPLSVLLFSSSSIYRLTALKATTSWMMWHWAVSSLASGLTAVVYDG